MMHTMNKKWFPLLLAVLTLFMPSCGGPADPEPEPGPEAPAAITLSESSFLAAQAGGTFSLTVRSPQRPAVSGLPAWLTLTDGTYNLFSITFGLKADANDTYESRSATMTVSCAGASSVTFTVSQEGKPEVTEPEPDPGADNGTARELAERLGLGWNLGNQFDGLYNGSWAGDKEGYPDEVVWQPDASCKATQATFDKVKEAGFTSVRIPVSWLRMIGPAPEHRIDEDWMDRVYEVVGFAHAAGLNVIINTHHDENHGADNDYQWLDIKKAVANSALNAAIQAKIKAVWTQIAQKFADCGDWLIMESFNEINDGGWGWSDDFRKDPTRQCNILNDWNQVFVDAVRATGGNNATRWLGVPTYAANPSFASYFKMPDDPAGRLMLAVHFYDPSEYTIGAEQFSDWGHTGAAGRKASYGDENHVKEVFGKLYEDYVKKDIPVYLGEFGCSMRAKSDTRAWAFYLYYMEYVVKAARTYGLPCFVWDNGGSGSGQEQHGYFHHGTGAWLGNSAEVVAVMRRAWKDDNPSYTLQSVYDKAPKF